MVHLRVELRTRAALVEDDQARWVEGDRDLAGEPHHGEWKVRRKHNSSPVPYWCPDYGIPVGQGTCKRWPDEYSLRPILPTCKSIEKVLGGGGPTSHDRRQGTRCWEACDC
ncbi:hypothetical protein NDU88_005717 [Pleurodeles waltl]|uniref:Uncharacterized protein n=1 Tax=Pleurodeles waltl TaxID=8319 RepID=A0AAV7WVI2_PLEWA|nr:hypothetical protein NDU88_005717 [Pleurodeles waltl]